MANPTSKKDIMNWLNGLNPEQQEAVLHNEGPMLILAGAGSGKTTVLVSRTGRLVEEGLARASEIKVMTFTNKAARELKERVSKRLGKAGKDLWAGTFHSFGLEFLKLHAKHTGLPARFGVIDQADAGGILKELLRDITHSEKDAFDLDRLLKMMSQWREDGQTKAKTEEPYEQVLEILLPKYLKKMRQLGVVDFDDLILWPRRLLKENEELKSQTLETLKFLMVDEFQDTNRAQMDLVRELLGPEHNLTVVGDDDQAIYGWRGAKIENILHFPRNFKKCRVVRLERNYRSTQEILNLANAIICKNENRHGKTLRPHATQAGSLPELFVYQSEEEEADEVPQQVRHFQRMGYQLSDMAILYRSNTQGGLIEGSLRRNQVPYLISGGFQIFDRKEARDVMAYLRAALYYDELSLRRVIQVPARGIGDVSLDVIQKSQTAGKISFWAALGQASSIGVGEKQQESIRAFILDLEKLKTKLISGKGSIQEEWNEFFREIGYWDYLRTLHKKADSIGKHWEVVEIVGRILASFTEQGGRSLESLKDFLDKMSLRDADSEKESENSLQMMTLHASKGLEFPVVILVGVDEDVLPHRRLGLDISEERRLFYVGVTRAKEKLLMTRSRQRRRHGRPQPAVASRFILEIDRKLLDVNETGFRAVAEDDRKAMLSGLLKKLNDKSDKQKVEEDQWGEGV